MPEVRPHFPDLLETWRRDQVPVWKDILAEAETKGQERRAEYARWILREVLQEVNAEVSTETNQVATRRLL